MAAKPLIWSERGLSFRTQGLSRVLFSSRWGTAMRLLKAGAVPMLIPPLDDRGRHPTRSGLLSGECSLLAAPTSIAGATGTCSTRQCGCWTRAREDFDVD